MDRQNESFLLKQLNFTDGGNELKIWMEDEKGHRVENSESQKEFWLDSSKPVVHYEITGGSEIWHKDIAEVPGRIFRWAKWKSDLRKLSVKQEKK